MARKSKFKRPVFQPIPIDEYDPDQSDTIMAQAPEANVYIRSTHYSTEVNGSLTSTSETLIIPNAALSPADHQDQPEESEFSYNLETNFAIYLSSLDEENADQGSQDPGLGHTAKKRRVANPIAEWLPYRENFLSEFLRLEGKAEGDQMCTECWTEPALYRCLQCDALDLVCQSCCLRGHKRNGLHFIEKWDSQGQYFRRVSLRSLGYSIQLGHPTGEGCINPELCYAGTFTVLDTHGIHHVTLNFCNCETKQPHYIQLLRFGWFPATVSFPRTAFTLRLLKHFQIMSFEAKLTVYEYHSTLQRLTDNTGTHLKHDRYSHFLRVVREYRHLKMLKRAGRGHNIDGAGGTRHGECAVICPACPQPGMNLPDGWRTAPENERFLYRLFLGMDANFRLKRRLISSNAADPSLSGGWSYFVEEENYKEFLNLFGTLVIQEPSRCSNHDAVNKERGREGFAASGIGACDCIRHDMKRPSSVGDLQKGERYVNMDYLFLSSLSNIELVEIIASYDIMCQYSIHLWERMKTYPHWLHVDHENQTTFRFLIPKFHLPAHIRPCQTRYSFNYNTKVGRTDGEAPERGWSHANGLATSTREMGPGSRRDTLDDHFGDGNWAKTTAIAHKIITKIKEALEQSIDKAGRHEQFSKKMGNDHITDWSKQLDDWEADHDKPNPFESTYAGISQEAVRRRFADEEEADLIAGSAFVAHEEISASRLISMGLDYEVQQRRLGLELKQMTAHVTDDQKAKWKTRSNILRRKILSWIEVEHLYIPSLYLVRRRESEDTGADQPETPVFSIPLYLPSAICARTSCDPRLINIEWELRYAQCSDALDDIRNALCLRAFVLIDRTRFQRGQRANTRSQGIVDRIQLKLEEGIIKYRVGRDALVKLGRILEKVGWEELLPTLLNEDIRTLGDDEDNEGEKGRKKGKSEGRRTVSWIWTKGGGEVNQSKDERLHESLRIEWCKSRARKDRWAEELELLQEEQRRILAFFQYKAAEWDTRASDNNPWMLPGVPFDALAVHGRISFAREQAAQFRRMHSYCSQIWQNVKRYIEAKGVGVVLVPKVLVLTAAEPEDNDSEELPVRSRFFDTSTHVDYDGDD